MGRHAPHIVDQQHTALQRSQSALSTTREGAAKRHSLVIVPNGRQDANLNESRAVLDSTHHAVHPQHHVGREIDRSRLVPGERRMHRLP
jgi:hypothetical protein